MKITFKKSPTSKIEFDKARKIPWMLGMHAFLVILLLILADLTIGVWLFYNFAILPQIQKPEIVKGTTIFEYSMYQKVLNSWQTKQQHFATFITQTPSNPFDIRQ